MLKRILKNLIKWIQSEENSGSTSQNIQLIQSSSIYLFDKKKNITSSSFAEQFKEGDYEKALEKAWHNRDFEIEMYWKRASYFWTFIGATFLGYFALIGSKGYHEFLSDGFYQIEVFIITIGLIFSMAWYFVNKGSKGWQVNWEAQVDELESLLGRPNYTTIFYNHKNKYYSVSRINQRVSLIVTLIWVLLYVSYWIRWYPCYLMIFEQSIFEEGLNWASVSTVPIILSMIVYLFFYSKSNVSEAASTIMKDKSFKDSNDMKEKKDRNKFFFKRIRKEQK